MAVAAVLAMLAAGEKKSATVHLQKRLEHDGLVTPPDVIKVPENTQQKSKHCTRMGLVKGPVPRVSVRCACAFLAPLTLLYT